MSRVLDVGAGAGKQAYAFAERGAHVTAIDVYPIDVDHPNIAFRRTSAEDFLNENTDTFDIVFARNILQFLPREYVLGNAIPKFITMLNPAGILAIETFYAEPIPPFDRPLTSLYSFTDLETRMGGLEILLSREIETDGPDLSGRTRLFSLTQVIGRRRP